MRKRFIAAIFVLLFGPLATALAEAGPAGMLITELQTGGAGTGTATQEFVELYNASASDLDVTGWKLQYRAASKLPADPWPATSSTAIVCASGSPVGCRVLAHSHSHIVMATSSMGITNALNLNGGFADTGGQIRLVDTNGLVSDFVGYGAAVDSETVPAPKPAGGESLKRKVDVSGLYLDTNNNLADFTLSCGQPSPGFDQPILAGDANGCPLFVLPQPEPQPEPPADPVITDPEPADTPTEDLPEQPTPEQPPEEPAAEPQPELPPITPEPTPEPPITPTDEPPTPVMAPLEITEVFPDPASPQSDAADEFVEIYNPNDQPVSLTGYAIKTGGSFEHSVTLPDVEVPAKAYVVVTSATTTLSLVNTGTAVRLVDVTGLVVSEAPTYLQALVGQSWIKNASEWAWTPTVTPGTSNVLTVPTVPVDPTETPDIPTEETGGQGAGPIAYLPILITELLPDPASPAQDDSDEFIELYNPNETAVDLAGYQLQSGNDYRYKYILPSLIIAPHQYLTITSEESGLVLSNSGSRVRLLNPGDELVEETGSYAKAVEGQSWTKTNTGEWQWSTTLTPGAPNTVTTPAPKTTKATPVVKKATTKKVSTAKPKVASASKTATQQAEQAYEEPANADQPPNYWLLAGIGSMAAGYGVYEYRQGISAGFRRLWQLARGKNTAD